MMTHLNLKTKTTKKEEALKQSITNLDIKNEKHIKKDRNSNHFKLF
jgi:hypothetical protein